ncbi:MAG: signal recognition particle-docking protein FtsY [Methyloceanibacter sp.]
MSDGKKASFFQRLLGIGDQPAEPAKKDPPQDSPKRDRPPEGPLKKDPPQDRPAKQEPPRPKGPARTAKPKAPPPAGPAAPPHDMPPDERPPSDRKQKSAEEKAAPSVFEPKTPRRNKPQPQARPAPPPAGSHGEPKDKSKASAEPTRSWFDQLRHGLARTSNALSANLAGALTKRKLDEDTLDRIEEVLIKADLGVAMAARIRSAIARGRYDHGLDPNTVRGIAVAEIAGVLEPVVGDFALAPGASPHVFLVVGVNGTGKTTTAAKMAYQFKRKGLRVMLAAADTFRAAAIDQLKAWGTRVGAEIVTKEVGADPAGVAFEAFERARAEGIDVLLIDTAGRLQNKSDLMAELAKIVRVLKKLDSSAPHGVILVLDATTGQNALAQVEIFEQIAGVTGLVVTKLDGTARGGILVAIAERFKLPIVAIGVGEGLDDLKPFDAHDFARAIAGAKSENEAAA